MATNQEEPSTSRSSMHEDNLRDHTLKKSDLDTSTLQSGAEALVALFKQVEYAVPRGVDVGTSPSPFSFSGSPSEGSRAPSLVPDEPTAHGEGLSRGKSRRGGRSYASAATVPSLPSLTGARVATAPHAASRGDKAASTGEDSSEYKLLSQKISGTGTFFLLRDDSCAGPRVPRVGEWGRLGEEERGERVKQAYVAAEAICQALVPNESMDLLDALMETTDVYRSRYGYRRMGLEGEVSRGAAGGSGGEEEDAVPVLPSNLHEAEDVLQLTPPFPGVGTVCLHRDKYTRKRRSEFVRLARSQRARVVKTAYEVVLAVAEFFCPGERMALLDRAFELHHGLTGRVHKKVTAALSNGTGYPDLTGLGLPAQAVGMLSAPAPAHNVTTSLAGEKAKEEGAAAVAAQGQSRKRPPPTPTLFAESTRTGTGGEEEESEDTSGGAGSGAVAKHFKPDLTYPPMNPFAAQLMAAHWAVAMSNPHMPFHPSGPSPSGLLSPTLPFASPLYQHHMMLAAAAASGNPYFYPHTQLGASSTSTGVSPVSGSWPPMATAEGEVNDPYAAGLDDSCSTFSGFAHRDTPSLSGTEVEAAQEGLGERPPQETSGVGKMDATAV